MEHQAQDHAWALTLPVPREPWGPPVQHTMEPKAIYGDSSVPTDSSSSSRPDTPSPSSPFSVLASKTTRSESMSSYASRSIANELQYVRVSETDATPTRRSLSVDGAANDTAASHGATSNETKVNGPRGRRKRLPRQHQVQRPLLPSEPNGVEHSTEDPSRRSHSPKARKAVRKVCPGVVRGKNLREQKKVHWMALEGLLRSCGGLQGANQLHRGNKKASGHEFEELNILEELDDLLHILTDDDSILAQVESILKKLSAERDRATLRNSEAS